VIVGHWRISRAVGTVVGAVRQAAAPALLAAAFAIPAIANAQALWPGAPPPASMQSSSAAPQYAPLPHLDAAAAAPEGWGLFAVASGRSMDLSASRSWAADPNALPGEIEVGYGWRRRNLSAVVGYAQPDSSVQPSYPVMAEHTHDLGGRGLVGLSLALRYR
jgi:hypothetical protein